MNKRTEILFIFFLLFCRISVSQNENSKWYFGSQAGLDFMTNPPTILTNGVINTFEGCSGISNSVGNLLFYTDGITVWNSSHVMMSNGNGLNGNSSTTQAAVVVKQPGNSNIYYVFTLACCNSATGVNYSTVDMNLSAGSGSVISKNIALAGTSQERLTSVRHCNGTDIWVLSQAAPSGDFRAHLVSALGVSTTPVISAIGSNTAAGGSTYVGYMKFSPNGKKLGVATCNSTTLGFDIYDFDASTGIVSSRLPLAISALAYGCEFSPDGTKFYGSIWNGPTLYQWDLCAGSNTAIVASQYTTASSGGGALQLAINGKIYLTRNGQSMMGVISNPNVSGSGCNYSDNGQSIFPKTNQYGLPNFITSGFKPPQIPFTHTVSNAFGCQTASYTAPPIVQNFSAVACAASGYSLTGILWNFGDPNSGSANTSTISNPAHAFTNLGTYTTQLILYYSCGGGTDTIKQQVIINQPCISVTSTSITCANLGSATVQATGGIGPYSYTWTPTGQTNSVATGLSPGSYTLRVFDFGNNFTYTATTIFTSLIPLTGNLINSSSLTCYGAGNGTAAVTNLAGGSGTQNYLWTNGINTYTAPNPQNLSAGNYTYTVTDALTGCTINGGFFISQPPALTLNIATSSPTTCAGVGVILTGTASGGTPISPGAGYNYSWTSGPVAFSYTPTETLSGAHFYTLTARDVYSCQTSKTISINVISNPVLIVNDFQICPFETGTLSALGATTYTWNSLYTGTTFTANPLITTQYTVAGTGLGCTSVATASIILKPVPVPTITTNGPLCEGYLYWMNAAATTTLSIANYTWNGPAAYTAAIQNPTINPVGLGNTGIYNLSVTAVNGCTASINNSLVVFATPSLTASGSTVCIAGVFNLISSSDPGASYFWSGPLGFSSNQQNVFVPNAITTQSGPYNIAVTGMNGCVNNTNVNISVLPPPVLGMSLNSYSTCAQGFNGSPASIGVNFSGAASYSLITPNYIANNNPFGTSSGLSLLPPYLNTGPTTITLIGSNGYCTSNITTAFTIVPNPTVTLNNVTPVICLGQAFTYNSSGATSYVWASANPTITLNVTGNTAVANTTMSALFSVFGSSLGCNSATQNSTLTVNPLPQFSISPNPAIICLGDAITLSVVGTGTSYTWSPPFFLNTKDSILVTVNPNTQQNYVVTAGLNNCTLSAGITVSVLPIPTPFIIAPKTAFCAGDSVVMFGYGGQSYTWNGPKGFTAFGQDLGFNAPSSVFSGIYTLTANGQNNCKGKTTQGITIYDLPQGYLTSANMKGCAPLCANLNFINTSANTSLTTMNWKVNNLNFYGSNFKYCFDFPGDFIIKGDLTDQYGCANTVTAVVNVYQKPLAEFDFDPAQPIERLDEIQFIAGSKGGANQFYWDFGVSNQSNAFGSPKFTSTKKDPKFTFEDMGTYPVALVVQNQWNCVDTIVKAITVYPDFAVYVPNSFTPNDDGLNEVFIPVMRGAKSFNLSVFNRWGKLIFESSDMSKGWDGTYKGEACKEDVYIWKLNVQSQSEVVSKSGKQSLNMAGEVVLYR